MAAAFVWRAASLLTSYVLLAIGFFMLSVLAVSLLSRRGESRIQNLTDTFRSILSQSREPCALVSKDFRIRFLNRSASDLLQRDPSNGLAWEQLPFQRLDRTPLKREDWFTFLKVGKMKVQFWRDESPRFLQILLFQMPFESDQSDHFLVIQDITDDLIRERALSQSRDLLSKENRALSEKMYQDPLTDCFNKHYWTSFYEARNQLTSKDSLLLIDLDDFKRVNDTQGHLFGDQFLKKVAETLRSFFRKSDRIIRYGGDEFVVVLPQTNIGLAQMISNRLLERFQKAGIQASIGISEARPSDTAKSWFQRADTALYEAKRLGKHRAELEIRDDLEILTS